MGHQIGSEYIYISLREIICCPFFFVQVLLVLQDLLGQWDLLGSRALRGFQEQGHTEQTFRRHRPLVRGLNDPYQKYYLPQQIVCSVMELSISVLSEHLNV